LTPGFARRRLRSQAGVLPPIVTAASTADPKGERMKAFSIVMLILSTLCVLAWPYFLIVTPFLFDSPHGNGNDTRIGIFIVTLLTYPLGWVITIGLVIVRLIRKSPTRWWQSPTGYLFLTPFVQIAAAALMFTTNFMGYARK
jgi:hypothetical protein